MADNVAASLYLRVRKYAESSGFRWTPKRTDTVWYAMVMVSHGISVNSGSLARWSGVWPITSQAVIHLLLASGVFSRDELTNGIDYDMGLSDKGAPVDGERSDPDALASQAPTPVEALEAKELSSAIDTALASLRGRDEMIIRLRYGLGDYDQSTFEQIGNTFGISPTRAKQIKNRSLRMLRHPYRVRALNELRGKEST